MWKQDLSNCSLPSNPGVMASSVGSSVVISKSVHWVELHVYAWHPEDDRVHCSCVGLYAQLALFASCFMMLWRKTCHRTPPDLLHVHRNVGV
jgi:hypothetical protein